MQAAVWAVVSPVDGLPSHLRWSASSLTKLIHCPLFKHLIRRKESRNLGCERVRYLKALIGAPLGANPPALSRDSFRLRLRRFSSVSSLIT